MSHTFHRHHLLFPALARSLGLAILLTGILVVCLPGPLAVAAPASHLPCGEPPEDDPYLLPGFQVYFADEFNCEALGAHWVQQEMMTPASYVPPPSGYATVAEGRLMVGVHGPEHSFPFLYLVDDAATIYDIAYTQRRVDWLPNRQHRMRISMRMRFQIEEPGDHRISIYGDGHAPAYSGPLFYVGSDYNGERPEWHGLVLGADGGVDVVDMKAHGYASPYTDWFVFTVDFVPDENYMTLSVDNKVYLIKRLSEFREAGLAAVIPDVLYIGSLARLEHPTSWIDLELDWLRVYVPDTVPPSTGLLDAAVEAPPAPQDVPTTYSLQLPAGPFAHTPHWSEDFDNGTGAMPSYWRLLVNHDPANSRTRVVNDHAAILSNDQATGVPVWGIVDDVLPATPLLARGDWGDYFSRRRAEMATAAPLGEQVFHYPRVDWRPNRGNIRYAWRAIQTAGGYGVEVSNGGHYPHFTGAMFYTLLDTTKNGQGQFIFPSCQEKYFWVLNRLPEFRDIVDRETVVTADYINGAVYLYVNGIAVGWWLESDCSLNWYLYGPNASSPELLFFGNPAKEDPGSWSHVYVDWFATFPGLPRQAPPKILDLSSPELHLYLDDSDSAEPFEASVDLRATGVYPGAVRWQAHLSTGSTWISLSHTQGDFAAPGTDSLGLAVSRPLHYGTYKAILIVEGWTAERRAVPPVQTVIHLHYGPNWRQLFLPSLAFR